MVFFTETLSHTAIDLNRLACTNSPLERQRLLLYIKFRPSRFHLVAISCPWFLHSDGENIKSNHQFCDIPSFPSTMAYKARSPVTKIRDLTELHIVFSLDGGRVQPWGRIINFFLPLCIQTRKHPKYIFFSLSSIGAMTVLPGISPLYFLHWKRESLKILVMFLPGVNFALIFILVLNDPFPWYPPITRSIDMISFFLPLRTSYGITQR